jgi:hypothetical protein
VTQFVPVLLEEALTEVLELVDATPVVLLLVVEVVDFVVDRAR